MMFMEVGPVALLSAAVFGGITLLSNRPRGASLAQSALLAAAAMVFVSILAEGPVMGLTTDRIATLGVALMAAAVAGMLYHLYLGRFENVWAARAVFTLVYLVAAALFGVVLLSLI